jgi:hypothetical protein
VGSKRRFISSHCTENLNTRLFEFQRDNIIIITTYEPDLTLRLASVQPLIGTLYEEKEKKKKRHSRRQIVT